MMGSVLGDAISSWQPLASLAVSLLTVAYVVINSRRGEHDSIRDTLQDDYARLLDQFRDCQEERRELRRENERLLRLVAGLGPKMTGDEGC